MLHACTCKDKQNKPADKHGNKWKEKHAKDKLGKDTKRGQTNMLSNKRGCPRRTNVGLDQVSIVPLDWSMDDTRTHA